MSDYICTYPQTVGELIRFLQRISEDTAIQIQARDGGWEDVEVFCEDGTVYFS